MFKFTKKGDFKNIEKNIIGAVIQQITQNPSAIEKQLNEKVKELLVDYHDEIEIKPEVIVRVGEAKCSGDYKQINASVNIEVLNGDEAYKNRVIEFVKSRLK